MTLLAAIPGALKLVPSWVWLALAGALAWHFALSWHASKVEAFGDERFRAGRDSRDSEMIALQRELDKANQALADELRSLNDEKLVAVARDADDVRVRGPGRATCPADSFLPAAAGRHEQADRAADAAVGEVHSGERPVLIALPFTPAVDFAEGHDAYRIEALGWREWHRRFTAEWAAWEAAAAARSAR